MVKRTSSLSLSTSPSKKLHLEPPFSIPNIASPEAGAAADADPPLGILLRTLKDVPSESSEIGDAVVYWMRMEDMRSVRSSARRSRSTACLFRLEPAGLCRARQKRSSNRFYSPKPHHPQGLLVSLRHLGAQSTFRILTVVQDSLAEFNIPLHVSLHSQRRTQPSHVISFLQSVNAIRVYANIEYEVDELRRDITVCKLANDNGIIATFVHDKLIIEPGLLLTKQGKPYSVYSPFQRQWVSVINADTDKYLAEAKPLDANSPSVKDHPSFRELFAREVPSQIDGFECLDKDKMVLVWPAGTDTAREMLRRFLRTKSRATHLGIVDPLEGGAEASEKRSRAMVYNEQRDHADRDTTSRLSPYLAAGVISARECVRTALEFLGTRKMQTNRDSGIGMWIHEIAWRDFYTHVLAAFPRVSMGLPFQGKYADVQWESNPEHFEAWTAGRTGVPIVDAGIRQANTMGWMHNRVRMIAAMYLTKDLMIDWRLGERHFMQQFIDGDLASNNGGWQWSASTGTDPQPYFRIFNPYSQSEKADPSGDYIRTFVPELRNVFGPEIHNPSAKLADRVGYPRPLVDHKEARGRALRRYKNPGSK